MKKFFTAKFTAFALVFTFLMTGCAEEKGSDGEKTSVVPTEQEWHNIDNWESKFISDKYCDWEADPIIINQSQSSNGYTVTLNEIYTDGNFFVCGVTVEHETGAIVMPVHLDFGDVTMQYNNGEKDYVTTEFSQGNANNPSESCFVKCFRDKVFDDECLPFQFNLSVKGMSLGTDVVRFDKELVFSADVTELSFKNSITYDGEDGAMGRITPVGIVVCGMGELGGGRDVKVYYGDSEVINIDNISGPGSDGTFCGVFGYYLDPEHVNKITYGKNILYSADGNYEMEE